MSDTVGMNGSERAAKARERASEAAWLAVAAFNEELRNFYLELQRQWNMLANEIEYAEEASARRAERRRK